MAGVFGESERSEPKRRLELNTAVLGLQECPPQQPQWSACENQDEPEHLYIKEEEVCIKEEELEFELSLKEENKEGDQAAEPARISVPEGHLRPGEQRQFEEVKKEFPPEQPVWSISMKWEEPEHSYINEEEEEVCFKEEGTGVSVKSEENEVDLSLFDQSFKEKNGEDDRASGPASTSGPEGQLGLDHQQQLRTPSLDQEEPERYNFKLKKEPNVAVKSEGNEELAEISQLHQSVTEDSKDCGGPGLVRNPGPDGHLGPVTEDETYSSETEDSDDWMTPLASQRLKTVRNQTVDCKVRDNTCDKLSCPEHCKTCGCDPEFGPKRRKCKCKFSCPKYGKSFTHRGHLQKQERIHTGEKPYSCSHCGKRFIQNSRLQEHERIHTGEKPFSCSQCGERFRQKATLRMHERIHTGEKPFSCSQCAERFIRKRTLMVHELIHTGEKPFMCCQCDKRFKLKSELRYHEKIHTGENLFSCSQCGKKFTENCKLRKHERIHTGEKPFSCSQCGDRFTRKDTLGLHEMIHTGEKPFSCSQCGKGFPLKRYLRLHERSHTGLKPFSCSQCGKCFVHKGSLKLHEKVHKGEKPFSCSACGKGFIRSAELLKHEQIHTGERPFSCSQCSKCFAHKGSLKSHEKVHKGEKPYSCSECGKTFSRDGDRRRHQRIHTGEKYYSCCWCGKRFTHNSQLRRHEKIHTGEKKTLVALSVVKDSLKMVK